MAKYEDTFGPGVKPRGDEPAVKDVSGPFEKTSDVASFDVGQIARGDPTIFENAGAYTETARPGK